MVTNRMVKANIYKISKDAIVNKKLRNNVQNKLKQTYIEINRQSKNKLTAIVYDQNHQKWLELKFFVKWLWRPFFNWAKLDQWNIGLKVDCEKNGTQASGEKK